MNVVPFRFNENPVLIHIGSYSQNLFTQSLVDPRGLLGSHKPPRSVRQRIKVPSIMLS